LSSSPSPLVCCKLHRDIIQGGGGVIAHDSSKKKRFCPSI
jgi:hypothetical protein